MRTLNRVGIGAARSAASLTAMLALVILAPFSALADTADRHALVVGNGSYAQSGWRLDNPVRDAQLMQSTLDDLGFEVELITDGDEDRIQEGLRTLRTRLRDAGPDAVGVFYYAGHAAQDEGRNLLIPVDAAAETMADLWGQSVPVTDVTRAFRQAGNRANFIIIDACRDLPLPNPTRSLARGLAPGTETSGLLIAYATAPGQVASDGEGVHSPYTVALAEIMRTPGLAAELMFKRVRDAVDQATGGVQRPNYESGLSGSDFCFAGCAMDERDQEAAGAWRLVSGSDDPEVLGTFLTMYGDTAFGDPARARLAQVEAAAAPAAPVERAMVMTTAPVFDRRSELANQVGSLRIGQQVDVLERLTDRRWVTVRLADGTEGYVLDRGVLRVLP